MRAAGIEPARSTLARWRHTTRRRAREGNETCDEDKKACAAPSNRTKSSRASTGRADHIRESGAGRRGVEPRRTALETAAAPGARPMAPREGLEPPHTKLTVWPSDRRDVPWDGGRTRTRASPRPHAPINETAYSVFTERRCCAWESNPAGARVRIGWVTIDPCAARACGGSGRNRTAGGPGKSWVLCHRAPLPCLGCG